MTPATDGMICVAFRLHLSGLSRFGLPVFLSLSFSCCFLYFRTALAIFLLLCVCEFMAFVFTYYRLRCPVVNSMGWGFLTRDKVGNQQSDVVGITCENAGSDLRPGPRQSGQHGLTRARICDNWYKDCSTFAQLEFSCDFFVEFHSSPAFVLICVR